jgi:hypothetical protein
MQAYCEPTRNASLRVPPQFNPECLCTIKLTIPGIAVYKICRQYFRQQLRWGVLFFIWTRTSLRSSYLARRLFDPVRASNRRR